MESRWIRPRKDHSEDLDADLTQFELGAKTSARVRLIPVKLARWGARAAAAKADVLLLRPHTHTPDVCVCVDG